MAGRPTDYALALVCVIVACVSTIVWVNNKPNPIVSTTERPPGSWRFQPQSDMTPVEAAMAVSLMLMGPDFIPAVGEKIQAMPPEFRRHWLPPESH